MSSRDNAFVKRDVRSHSHSNADINEKIGVDSNAGVAWTEEEHKSFLIGLQKLGKGDWRGISRHFVFTRTPTQVASHAQKYFIRQTNVSKRKRRHSLFDIVTSGQGGEEQPNDVAVEKSIKASAAPAVISTTTTAKAPKKSKSSGPAHKSTTSRATNQSAKPTVATAKQQARTQAVVACESALNASLSNLADIASREPHYVASTHQRNMNMTSTSIKVDEDGHRSMAMASEFSPFGMPPPGGFKPAMFDAYNQAMAQYMSQLQALAAQQGDGQSHLNQINQMNQMAWMAQQNLAYQMAAQSFASNARHQQMAHMAFSRPTAMYAAKAFAERNAASGGA